MYRKFYGLRGKPFSLTSDPENLYLSQHHKDALAFLTAGYKKDLRLIVFTGEIGSGKTLLLKTFIKSLGPEVKLIQLFYPPNDRIQLLQMILVNLGISSEEDDIDILRENLKEQILKLRNNDKKVLLMIDEAQNMGEEALEETILLSRIEYNNKCLIKIILAGFPKLLEKISFLSKGNSEIPSMENFHLKNLPEVDVRKYINYRLTAAGCLNPEIFPQDVIKEIGNFSEGAPRLINMACDAALLHGYFSNVKVITLPIIKKVLEELFYEGMSERGDKSESFSTVTTSSDIKLDTRKKQILQERVKKVYLGNREPSPDYIGLEETSVQNNRLKNGGTLPLTVLVLEKNARMRVHLENKFQEQGFISVKFPHLEDIIEILNRSIKLELQVLVADAAFFFTKDGHETPCGKSILDKINSDYAYVPLIMTSDLPLSSIRIKLFQRGIPYLLHKPDLNGLDMSEVPRQFNMFFNELKNCLENIHSKFVAFYMRVTG